MNKLVPADYPFALSTAVRGDLARHLGRMEHITLATGKAIDEISAITQYTELRVATTMEMARRIQAASGTEASPLERQAAQQRAGIYLGMAGNIVESAGLQLLQLVSEVPMEERSDMDDLLTWLQGR